MLQSMTGYGRSEGTVKDYAISVEIKSLNGKQFELNQRLPLALRQYEINIKNLLLQHLQRGSIEININLKQNGSAKAVKLNTELASFYYQAVQQLSSSLNTTIDNPLATVLQLPEVVAQVSDEFTAEEWPLFEPIIAEAAAKLTEARTIEGKTLAHHLISSIDAIAADAKSVEQFEGARIDKLKQKLLGLLEEHVGTDNVDRNRFEQELIYYLERFDISEEKVRLAHHINYFKQCINNTEDTQIGKKLGFVLQEVGREINTMGSKANDAQIQQLVVLMKDNLEKAKEQILNVL